MIDIEKLNEKFNKLLENTTKQDLERWLKFKKDGIRK